MGLLRLLFSGRMLAFLLAVALLCAGAFLIYGSMYRPGAYSSSFTVMTANTGSPTPFNKTMQEEGIAWLADQAGNPDILMLQEVNGKWQGPRLAAAMDYPYLLYPDLGSERETPNICLLSRFPLRDPDALVVAKLPWGAYGAFTATASINGRDVLLCTVHLPPLDSAKTDSTGSARLQGLYDDIFGSSLRNRAADLLLPWLAGKKPQLAVIGGDFNTIQLSKAIRGFTGVYHDALWPRLDYFLGSYHQVRFPIKPRIDYIFTSPGLVVAQARILRLSIGDHYPLWSEIGF